MKLDKKIRSFLRRRTANFAAVSNGMDRCGMRIGYARQPVDTRTVMPSGDNLGAALRESVRRCRDEHEPTATAVSTGRCSSCGCLKLCFLPRATTKSLFDRPIFFTVTETAAGLFTVPRKATDAEQTGVLLLSFN